MSPVHAAIVLLLGVAPEPLDLTGRIVRLTHTDARNAQPFWSPDGRHISFVSNRSGTWQVWTMNADGTDQRQLTKHPQPVGWPSWSSSGDRILYYAGAEAYRLYSIGVSGGDAVPFHHEQPSDFRPLQSPDGRLLLFDRYEASTELRNHEICVRDLATGALAQLTHDPGYDSDARWSPSGDRIVWHSDRDDDPGHLQVYVMRADGSDPTRLTSGDARNGYPSWSPDGDQIVYTSERDDRRNLRLMSARGTNDRPLTSQAGLDGEPAWSPDGRFILFSTTRYSGSQELALLPLGLGGRSLEATFIGNMAFHISDGEIALLTDFPYESGAFGYMTWTRDAVPDGGSSRLCLVTHAHRDHFAPELAPDFCDVVLGPIDATLAGVEVLQVKEIVRWRDLTVHAIATPHATLEHYSYLVEWGGARLFFTGDTEEPEALLAARDIDAAFVNPWLLRTLAERPLEVDAKRLIVYHHAAGERVVRTRSRIVPRPGEVVRLLPGEGSFETVRD